MNDTLKVASRIGAELGAAKAENEKLRGLLERVATIAEEREHGYAARMHGGIVNGKCANKLVAMLDEIHAALSQQAGPASTTEAYTARDMATAAAQGFRDGQAAVEQATAKDETEPVYQFQWREIGEGDWMACSHSWFRFCEASPEHDTRVVEVARPAQTAPQGKFRMGDLVKKSTGSEWEGRVVGWYSTEQTKEGYAVESSAHRNSVQIYPITALEAVE